MASTINAQTSPFAAIVQTADNTGNLAFQTANVTALTITTSQNVGIGTASPSNTFVVGGSNPQIQISGSGTSSDFRMNAAYGAAAVAAVGTVGAHPMFFFTSNTERMRIDSSGNVGIGTSSPVSKLNIYTTDASSKITLSDSTVGTGYGGMIYGYGVVGTGGYMDIGVLDGSAGFTKGIRVTQQATSVRFFTGANSAGNTERMVIDSSGNLGFGGTPSAWATLTPVLQMGTGGTFLSARTTQSVLYLGTNAYYNGTNWIYTTSNPASYYAQNSGQHQWNTAATGTAGATVSFTQAMTLDASGNLGIGTSSPQKQLHIAGSTNVVEARLETTTASNRTQYVNSGQSFYVGLDSSTAGSFGFAAYAATLYGSGAYPMVFGTNGLERMRIDSSGNVGIGTSSPASALHVERNGSTNIRSKSTSSTAAAEVYAINSSGLVAGPVAYGSGVGAYGALGSGEVGYYSNTSTTIMADTAGSVLKFAVGGSGEKARFSAAGGFSVGTTADPGAGAIYATGSITANYSDDRLKTKLGGIENALDKVKSLSGFYYEANQTAQDLGYQPVREVGVSAQQVQAVLPEVVKPAPIDQQYLTVQYERIIPLLIEAIKELEAQVADLKKGAN